jgi:predicted RNA-binding protein (virulence factor B family)
MEVIRLFNYANKNEKYNYTQNNSLITNTSFEKNKIISASKASGIYKKGININLAGFCLQL